jgi:hypothetical protein
LLNIPAGKYYIAQYKIGGGDKKNDVTDIIFKNCDGLIINGNNCSIRVNGKFTRTKGYQLPGLAYNYSYNNTVCPFRFSNCKNVQMRDMNLYGEVDKMKKEAVVEGQNYGVHIEDEADKDSCSNFVLQNIKAHHFAADGFVISANGRKIKIINCASYKNARQGLSIVKGHDIFCYQSVFDSTGNTGAYGWHAPGAGVDVENEFGKDKLTNLQFVSCTMRGNNGFQFLSTLASDSIVVDSCFFSDKLAGYGSGLNGIGMYSIHSVMKNCIIFGTIQVDIADFAAYKGPDILQFKNNLIYSGNRAFVCSDFNRPVDIDNNFLIMLPKPDMGTYFPYIQSANCSFTNNLVVFHPDRLEKNPNLVMALVQYTKQVANTFWLLNSNKSSNEKKYKHFFVPAFTDSKVMKNIFFPPSDIMDRYEFNGKKSITQLQANKIVSYPLFSVFKQTVFNRKYLVQADEVRKYVNTIINSAK